uniref:CCZ1/INTU/HSP4 first Longin domain-containing protein n=1 Tax=Oncorhynchus tshawytscha TaxID=74940 RepID=A0A8C8H9L8_ONCTS
MDLCKTATPQGSIHSRTEEVKTQTKLMLMISLRMTLRMQEKRYTSSLLSFFIYNPSFWPWEGEEKKILFYHPSEVEKNEKIRNVGHKIVPSSRRAGQSFCHTTGPAHLLPWPVNIIHT